MSSISPFGYKSSVELKAVNTMKLHDELLDYVQRVCFMRGFSKATIDNYKWAVVSLIDCVGNINVKDLKLEHLIEWRTMVIRNGWSTNSINAYSYKLRKFLKYLYANNKLKFDPDTFLIPKKEHKLPSYLTLDQCRQLFSACKSHRERLVVALLFSTGLRVSELVRIRTRDIQGDKLLVRGKANKERYAFIDSVAIELIKKIDTEYLFPSRRGGHICKSVVQLMLRDLSKRTGLHVTPHVLRHTYATQLLKNGCNLRHIQELLGHADISTTQIYTHVSNLDLAKAYKEHHSSLTLD